MGMLIPIILALIGLGAGVGAGVALRPDPATAEMDNPCGDMEHMAGQSAEKPVMEEEDAEAKHEYVKLNNQFIVPVVKEGRMASLVVMALTLEVKIGTKEAVFEKEPKLRDAFLQVLFDHANVGGFDGAFTSTPRMQTLRTGLLETAQHLIGRSVTDVLIIDVVRQDAATE